MQKTNSMAKVAIVGRPNVGKSAIFNRLVSQRKSIVHAEPGVTRDRLEAPCEWAGREFTLVDTGGLVERPESPLIEQVCQQVHIALQEADFVLFVVDVQEGLTPADEEVAKVVRESHKKSLLLANKAESPKSRWNIHEFYSLGFEQVWPVSALHGLGLAEVLDEVVAVLPQELPKEEPLEAIKVAIVGRPNVGKSSLLNALLAQPRVIVDEKPGTTRDAIDILLVKEKGSYLFIDTAGLRRPRSIKKPLERYSVSRALDSIRRADVAILMVDLNEGIFDQDSRIASFIKESSTACIIGANKWDLVPGQATALKQVEPYIRAKMPHLSFAPILVISALTRYGLRRILPTVDRVFANYSKKLSTSSINQFLQHAQEKVSPPAKKNRRLKIFYGTQVKTMPPFFALFVNDGSLMSSSYLKYLENEMRKAFDFEGTPVLFSLRKRR